MLVCFIVWFFLSVLSVFSAFSLLSLFLSKEEILKLFSLQPFMMLFIGILTLSNLFMIFAFLSPLRIIHIIVITVSVVSYVLFSLTKQDIYTLIVNLRENFLIILTSSLLSFFLISIPYGDSSDIAQYHIQAVRYLYEYGLIKGLALISLQLGHQSIWFALPAPFEDILGIYSSLIVCGFSLFISFCQFFRSLLNVSISSDEFFFICFFLISFISVYSVVEVTSVEIPLNIAIGMAAFCSLKYFSPEIETPDHEVKNLFFLLAVMFSILSFALKLSSIPLFLLGICLLIHRFRIKMDGIILLKFGILTTVTLLTKLLASTLVSGCPLYPSSLFHLKVPWFIGENTSRKIVESITIFSRLHNEKAPEQTSYLGWILPWSRTLGGKGVIYLLTFLITAILFSLFFSRKSFLKFHKNHLSIILFMLIGILYTFVYAPAVRFMGPYIIAIASVYLLSIFQKTDVIFVSFTLMVSFSISEILIANQKLGIIQGVLLFFLVLLVILNREKHKRFIFLTACTHKLILHLAFYIALTLYSNTSTNLLLLPEVSSLKRDFVTKEINGIQFFFPKKSTSCGYSPLPCSASNNWWLEFSLEDIELLDKEKGVAGGFKRKNYKPE